MNIEIKNFLLSNQSSLIKSNNSKLVFLARLEGFWNSTEDRIKIMEFIKKELEHVY